MLLDPADWSLSQSSDEVLAGLSPDLAARVQPETHAAVVELATGVHHSVAGVVSELRQLRTRLSRDLTRRGLAAAAAGTHPAAEWAETDISHAPRYRILEQSMRSLVRREPTMALHVHVGVPNPHDAVRLLNSFRSIVPILLALAANSPYSQGRDGGFASQRRVLFGAFPRTGTPRAFAGYADYVEAVDALIASAALPDPNFLWWDARLQPRLGTVELRVMDAQSSVADVEPLVALIQSFARLVLDGGLHPVSAGPEMQEENGFLAARDGMEAQLIDPSAGRLVPVRELLDDLLGKCRPHALALGCATELEGARRLAACNGAARQRASLRGGDGFPRVVARLAADF
jgi:glutamate---cysteine ligase / carboxylate-amine ligase